MKSVRIRSFSGPYFPSFGLNTERYRAVQMSPITEIVGMREDTEQTNSEYGRYSRNVGIYIMRVKVVRT